MPKASNSLFGRVSVQKRRIASPICDLTGSEAVLDNPRIYPPPVIDLTNSPGNQSESPKQKRRAVSPTVSSSSATKSPMNKPTGSASDRPHCPICLDEFTGMRAEGKTVVSTSCGHLFCKDDLTAALQKFRRCPTCAKTLKMSQFHPIYM